MNGYLLPHQLTPATRALYRGYQCGLCHTLEAEFGLRYRTFATADLVFFNIFLDGLGDAPAPIERRACPLAPVVSRNLPARARTANTRLTAAFGVYVGIEKLADDVADEGRWLKRLAYAFFRPGRARARALLVEHGFPVDELDDAMAAQAGIEAGGPLPLDDASLPTRRIARALFARAGADPQVRDRAAAVGDHVGAFLFYMDNLLDFPRDVARRGYNALARAFAVDAPGPLPDEARAAALAGARRQVEALTALLPGLGVGPHAAFLRAALVDGFADKVRRYEALPAARLPAADLPDLQPARTPRSQVLGDIVRRFAWRLVAPAWATAWRVRAALAFLVLWVAPRSAWAGAVADTAVDTGLDPALAADTGLAAADATAGLTDTDTSWDAFLDTCFCPRCCVAACDDALADSSCGDDCNLDCSPDCNCG